MSNEKPKYLNLEECVDHIMDVFGNEIKIGMPLGLGKPVKLINALYKRAKKQPNVKLSIYTALSLEKPALSSDLEKRFMGPVLERIFDGIPDLEFMTDLRAGTLPDNVRIHELFYKAGAYNNDPQMQQDYISSNYTHIARDMAGNEVTLAAQMLAKKEINGKVMYSSSCNADTTLEMQKYGNQARERGEAVMGIGVVNPNLPYMYGDAELSPDSYDVIIDDPECYDPLFAVPRQPVTVADYMIGVHASSLVKDDGTLQIGIGALGDAIAYGLHVRHNENGQFNQLIKSSGIGERYEGLIDEIGGLGVFEKGLYGSTEMLVDGFLQLYKNGVVKRKVYHHTGIQKLINDGKLENEIPGDILKWMVADKTLHPYLTKDDFDGLQRFGVLKEGLVYDNGEIVDGDNRYSALLADEDNLSAVSENCLGSALKNGVMLTGGFFIGPKDFYDELNKMPEEEISQFEMTGVEVANQLYGNETLRRLQRKNGRFCNTGLKATLMGAVCSDGLENGTVISGVGGQYNFVSMAHALEDGRCIILIKSTRTAGAEVLSNIVYNYGNTTIPRHLRDIVITEYGIADIRGKSDQDTIKAMLNITDSRFQEELMAQAKANGKLAEDYEIPEACRNNTPDRLAEVLGEYKALGLFPDFPCGTELSGEELFLGMALKALKAKSEGPEAGELQAMMETLPSEIPDDLRPLVVRMGLENPQTEEEKFSFQMLMLAFKVVGFC